MKTKTKRTRTVKAKPAEPELIRVVLDPNDGNLCNGCYFYKEKEEECTDKGRHDCMGAIYILKQI